MPRNNERMLAIGVVGLLAFILIIAVWFGDQPKHGLTAKTDDAAGTGGEAASIEEMLGQSGNGEDDGEEADPEGSADGDDAGAGADGLASEGGAADGELPAEDPDALPLVPESGAVAALGPYRIDQQFRVVTVREGDTFTELVQHWTGGLDRLDEVERLNEHVADARRLVPGTELYFPWVEDLELITSQRARRTSFALRSDASRRPREADRNDSEAGGATPRPRSSGNEWLRGRRATPAAGTRASASGTDTAPAGGERYKVKQGDSLWKIAARRVGNGKASAYVKEIVAATPGLTKPELVRAGQTIILP